MGKTRLGYGEKKKNSHVFCRTAEQKFRQTQSMRDVCVDRWGRNGGGLLSCEKKRSVISYPAGCGQTGVDIVGQMQKKFYVGEGASAK